MVAHRAAWISRHGPIPDGLFVMHGCDNRACVEVNHLTIGTPADNVLDMSEKGRISNGQAAKTHCPKGHAYDDENTYIDGDGHRRCRICYRANAAAWRLRNRRTV